VRVRAGGYGLTDDAAVRHVRAGVVLQRALVDRSLELRVGKGRDGDEEVVGLLEDLQRPRPRHVRVGHLHHQVRAVVVELREILESQRGVDALERRRDRVVDEADLDAIEGVRVDQVVDGLTDQPVADQANLRAPGGGSG
jgi:hypothetical protein